MPSFPVDMGTSDVYRGDSRTLTFTLALAAARRYIDSLLIALRRANVVPPDPPDDYTH